MSTKETSVKHVYEAIVAYSAAVNSHPEGVQAQQAHLSQTVPTLREALAEVLRDEFDGSELADLRDVINDVIGEEPAEDSDETEY
jgi:hypothetical protein